MKSGGGDPVVGRRIGRRAEDHWVVACTDCPNRVGHPRHYKAKKDCQEWWRGHAAEHHAGVASQ